MLVFLQSEDKNGLPTAQQAERKRKEERGLPGVRRAVRSQVPGERGKLGEVGEWQCEVRWGARRVVARREQGAVGNVSRREWGNFERKRHHKLNPGRKRRGNSGNCKLHW